MVATAVHGGVLHPSGMPLQAWVNRAAVSVSPASPVWTLSFVSWLGAVATLIGLFWILNRLGVGVFESTLALVAYLYIPTVALMAAIPEKYSWLSATQVLFLATLLAYSERPRPSLLAAIFIGLTLGLALAQHSALVVLVPPFLYVMARPFVRERSRDACWAFLSAGLTALIVTGGFYVSLLWLRAGRPWPDWGQLETLSDVWAHAVRRDYGYVQLFDSSAPGSTQALALRILLRDLVSWNGAFIFIFIGFFAILRTRPGRFLGGLLAMILIPSFAILLSSAMPTLDFDLVRAYQERYPLLVWPILTLFWGVGLSFVVKDRPKWRVPMRAVATVALVFFAVSTWRSQAHVRNNLADLYRDQVRFELDDFNIFWTSSDYFTFLGVPSGEGTLFPVKNLIGLNWYAEKVLPQISPAVARLFHESRPSDMASLVRSAVREGFKMVMTEATLVLSEKDLMAQAEQTGVLWTFSSANTALYTKKIVANTLHLCSLFERATTSLPAEGLYFSREFLRQFRYAFMSAGDYLQTQMELSPAQAAHEVARVLIPGESLQSWREACGRYQAAMKEPGGNK